MTDASSSLSATTNYTYNSLGQQIQVQQQTITALQSGASSTTSAHPTQSFTYNALGNLATVTDANSTNASTQVYEVDQPVPGSSGPGPVTLYYHDAEGNMTAEKDPDGYSTFFNRDALGRLSETRQTVALSRSGGTTTIDLALVSYFYDKNGNLTKKLDANGAVIAYAYNYQNQLTQERWFTSDTNFGSGTYTNTISYTYLTGGGLHTAGDKSASRRFMPRFRVYTRSEQVLERHGPRGPPVPYSRCFDLAVAKRCERTAITVYKRM